MFTASSAITTFHCHLTSQYFWSYSLVVQGVQKVNFWELLEAGILTDRMPFLLLKQQHQPTEKLRTQVELGVVEVEIQRWGNCNFRFWPPLVVVGPLLMVLYPLCPCWWSRFPRLLN